VIRNGITYRPRLMSSVKTLLLAGKKNDYIQHRPGEYRL
jgi:hypothetical protein